MGTFLNKTQLLTQLRNEQAAWEALLAEIGEAHMTQPEVAGGWSIKDIVAHLTGWRRRTVRRFQALLHHEPDFSPRLSARTARSRCNQRLDLRGQSRTPFGRGAQR